MNTQPSPEAVEAKKSDATTPQTEAFISSLYGYCDSFEIFCEKVEDFGANMERELNAAQAEAGRLREALDRLLYLCEHDLGMDEENPYIELARAALAKEVGE